MYVKIVQSEICIHMTGKNASNCFRLLWALLYWNTIFLCFMIWVHPLFAFKYFVAYASQRSNRFSALEMILFCDCWL